MNNGGKCMKLKKIISFLMALTIAVVTVLSCGITAGAYEKLDLKLNGYYSGNDYIVDLYGLTRKQYLSVLNGKENFIVYLKTGTTSFLVLNSDYYSFTDPSISLTGYNGSSISASLWNEETEKYITTLSNHLSLNSLYGNAPDRSYGFRFTVDMSDSLAKSIISEMRKGSEVDVIIHSGADLDNLTNDTLLYYSSVIPNWNGTDPQHSGTVSKPSGKNVDISLRTNYLQGYVTFLFTMPNEDYLTYVTAKKNGIEAYWGIAADFGYRIVVYNSQNSSTDNYTTTVLDPNGDSLSVSKFVTDSYLDDNSNIVFAVSFPNNSEVYKYIYRMKKLPIEYYYFIEDDNDAVIAGSENAQNMEIPLIDESVVIKVKDIPDQVYTGKLIKPVVTVTENGKELNVGFDYAVVYSNNKKVGQATVTVTGLGEYVGETTVTFNIVPKKVKLTSKTTSKSATLSWKKSAGATGYEIYRSVNGGKFTKLTTTKSLKYTAKLTAGKSYQFKVRPYATVNGKKFYGSWSNVVKTK